jgi:lipopolysaccharide export system protein LptA
MTSGLLLMLAFVMAMLVSPFAHGEKADLEQETHMSAKQASAEGSKEVNVKKLEGDVLITRGTMRVTAERALVKESPEGMSAELFGSSTSQITFRQKREGENDFVEASADRAEYDDNTGAIRLFSRVRFRSGGDVIESEYMQYNTNTEKMELRSQIPGGTPKSGTEEGRVTFVVQPRGQSPVGKALPRKSN